MSLIPLPLIEQKVFTFQEIGFDPQFAYFLNATLTQDKCLCILENDDTESNVVIVNLENNGMIMRHEIKTDTAVIHPSLKILAIIVASTIQILELYTKKRLPFFNLPEGYVVKYWKWTDKDALAFVAGCAVCHWTLSSQSTPISIFPLSEQLASGIIINYSVSHDQQWFAVSAICRQNDQTVGIVQFFSRERNISQGIDNAFAVSFANVGPLPLLVFATKSQGSMRMNFEKDQN